MKNSLSGLTRDEITRRIREAMIYILECKRTYFADVYCIAVKMAREVFGVTSEDEWYAIGCDVAKSYTDAHGQPEH
jgi:hypothetical protein